MSAGTRLVVGAGLTLVLGAGLVLFALSPEPEPADPTGPVALVPLKPDQVTGLRVTVGETDRWAVERRASGWALTLPVAARASEVELDELLQRLCATEGEPVDMAPNADNGLAPPTRLLTFVAGGRSVVLGVGRTSPFDARIYVRDEGGRVYLVPPTFANLVDIDPGRLRDRRLLVFDRQQVTSLTVAAPPDNRGNTAARLQLTRTADGWEVAVPGVEPVEADQDSVDGVLDLLEGVKAIGFRDQLPADATRAGAVTLSLKGGDRGLVFHGVTEGGVTRLLATSPDTTGVADVPLRLASGLDLSVDKLRRRKLLRVASKDIHRVVVTGETAFTAVRTGGEDEGWPWGVESDGEVVDAVRWKLARLMHALDGLKAKDPPHRVTPSLAEDARVTLELQDEADTVLGRIRLGGPSEHEGYVWATVEGPTALAGTHEVPLSFRQAVPEGAEELRKAE